jgi:two-component sensor histidine kinase
MATVRYDDRISSLWGGKRLRLAIEAAGIALWSWNADTDLFDMDDHACDLWGVVPAGAVTLKDLSKYIHSGDRDRVRAAFTATQRVLGAYEIDFRVMVGDDVRWISARGKGDEDGIVERVVFGTFLDVSGRKQAEEINELLAGEMAHRVKNLLAIASGLTAITARSATSAPELADALTRRLIALGRAHDLTRSVPGGGGDGDGALLSDLLAVLLAPYDDDGTFGGRLRVAVPMMRVGERAATTLALVIHELATNALKYGALSNATGSLDLSHCPEKDGFVLQWVERGGPPIVRPTGAGGFGSSLVRRSMASQLGGSIDYDWSSDGVVISLRIEPDRLAR